MAMARCMYGTLRAWINYKSKHTKLSAGGDVSRGDVDEEKKTALKQEQYMCYSHMDTFM